MYGVRSGESVQRPIVRLTIQAPSILAIRPPLDCQLRINTKLKKPAIAKTKNGHILLRLCYGVDTRNIRNGTEGHIQCL